MATEQWRAIKGFPGYQVSDLGNIRSSLGVPQSRGAPNIAYQSLKPYVRNDKGYLAIDLWLLEGGKRVRYTKFVHQIVAANFLDNRANTETVDHKNYKRDDNSLKNLEFKSRSQNTSEARQRAIKMSSNSD